jgi:hypothetical protein
MTQINDILCAEERCDEDEDAGRRTKEGEPSKRPTEKKIKERKERREAEMRTRRIAAKGERRAIDRNRKQPCDLE